MTSERKIRVARMCLLAIEARAAGHCESVEDLTMQFGDRAKVTREEVAQVLAMSFWDLLRDDPAPPATRRRKAT